MKKKFLFFSVVAALTLAGCSSDEPLVDNGNGNGDGNLSYLSVNIVSSPETIGRASGGENPGDTNYKDGTATENSVTKVRFYFFDENDNAAKIKADNPTANYFDWNAPIGSGTSTTSPVERQLEAVLIISTKAGDKLPVKLVAVVNPDASFGDEALSLTQLRKKVADYSTLANNATAPSFVMCNSVYATAAKEEMAVTVLTADNLKKSVKDAKNDPVYVYVERNVAKVVITDNLTKADDTKGLIKVQSKTTENGKTTIEDLKIDNEQVYVKLEGWNVTAELDKAFISKHIDPAWTDATCFGTAAAGTTLPQWNHPAYFRSYWAAECNEDTPTNRYTTYNTGKKAGFTETNNYVYCNENAVRTGTKKATQVIIPGTLCKSNGDALTLCEFNGVKFVDNTTQNKLKDAYLSYLNNEQKYYKAVHGADGKTTFTEITREDITFKTATAARKITAGQTGAYYVHVCLTDAALVATWHTSKEEGNTAIVAASTINTKLIGLPHAKIWDSGKTYYYFDIEHFNKKPGVVRNHLYSVSLTSLYGLGTPVYNPDETIYPEHPDEDDTYIAAKINILSWRVVPSSVDLNW